MTDTEKTHPTSFWKTLFMVMQEFHHIRAAWKMLLFFGMLYVLGMSIEPVFSKFIIDTLESWLTTEINISQIALLLFGWLVISILVMLSRYWYGIFLLDRAQTDWGQAGISRVRAMMGLPIPYHIRVQNGEKVKLLDRAIESVWETADIFFLEIFPYGAFLIILTIFGTIISPILTLVALIFLPFVLFLTQYFGSVAHSHQKNANIYWDKFFGRISDIFTNIHIIKVSAREDHEVTYANSLFQIAQEKQYSIRRYWLRFNSFWRFIKIIPRIFVFAVSIYLYARGEITIGTIFFFFSFTETIYTPIFSILQNYQQLMQSFAKYEQLQETLAMPREIDTGTQELTEIRHSITFENVSFRYPDTERMVLQDIDFEIEKWQRIALVGHTGSGKSTITQLLLRFYEPTEGKIRIDDTDIYDFTLHSYRQKFAAVFQDTTLFNETIRHNLEYVRDGITEWEIERACRQANIYDFIQSLPDAFETEVGERGLRLSGWEKQRLAIARAILADPEILILDEATSALDTKTEQLVQEAFDRLMQGRTSVVIAHRLSTIQNADRIYLLENGKIIAWGNHAELMKSSDTYREMVLLQHDGFLPDDDEEETPENRE